MTMDTRLRGGAIAGINVTPMADIMIVLLIIFMVMTPSINQGQVKHLPPAAHSRDRKERADTVVVSVTADGGTYLGQRRLDTGQLLPEVQALLATATERVVYIKADEGLAYSKVQSVMDLCRAAGAEEVALISRRKIGG
jgi:biopolymer transport protein ExbD/biopolymer transport protein TolR